MLQATFRFFGELNYFLPNNKKNISFIHHFKNRASVKDMIESLGVPHPEVHAILVEREAVDFTYLVQDGDRLEVYPATTDIISLLPLQPPLPPIPRFILDVHLGKLASYLRLLGFDSLYGQNCQDEELAQISAGEQRILLTRDQRLLMRSIVTYGYYVRATQPDRQVREILKRFNLFNTVRPFQRCMGCNGILSPIEKQAIIHLLPPRTKREFDDFYRCTNCGKIYWQGSHYQKLQQFVTEIGN
jgi:uncharacterized protein with PIN domain